VKCAWVWNATDSATIPQRHARFQPHLLCPLDAVDAEVFVRPKAGGISECAAKAARKPGEAATSARLTARRVGTRIFDDSLKPPWRDSLTFARPDVGTVFALAMRRATMAMLMHSHRSSPHPMGFNQGSPQRINHCIFPWSAFRAKHRYRMTRHVARAFGDQVLGTCRCKTSYGPANRQRTGTAGR